MGHASRRTDRWHVSGAGSAADRRGKDGPRGGVVEEDGPESCGGDVDLRARRQMLPARSTIHTGR